jgi:hypothetical protein
MRHKFYHPSYSEKFFFGFDGNNFATVENMDMGVFIVKETDKFSSGDTHVDKGVMPGILYRFI